MEHTTYSELKTERLILAIKRINELEGQLAQAEFQRDAALEGWRIVGEQLAALQERYKFEENQRLCVGFNGGCDGDLVASPHNELCPAREKDLLLNPHLYARAAEREGAQ